MPTRRNVQPMMSLKGSEQTSPNMMNTIPQIPKRNRHEVGCGR
jgi:hypothetical protein